MSLNILDPDLVVRWGNTVQRLNISHRVSHIKDFIEKYQGSQRRALTMVLPFLRLLDEMLTLEEAVLHNAAVIQRLQKTSEPFRKLQQFWFLRDWEKWRLEVDMQKWETEVSLSLWFECYLILYWGGVKCSQVKVRRLMYGWKPQLMHFSQRPRRKKMCIFKY